VEYNWRDLLVGLYWRAAGVRVEVDLRGGEEE
jgi:hypothetical protein